MAVNKAVESTSISIEVQNRQDKAGIYVAKKTFQMLKKVRSSSCI
ncbi:MAG: hypothetical protein ACLS28_02490 [Clostridium neonatale]